MTDIAIKSRVVAIASLLKQFSKVVIVIDQAKYHTSYQIQHFYEMDKEYLNVEYLPSYSPELMEATFQKDVLVGKVTSFKSLRVLNCVLRF